MLFVCVCVTLLVRVLVDRDDLADQGSAHVAATVQRLKAAEIEGGGNLRVETLCGDFQGQTVQHSGRRNI